MNWSHIWELIKINVLYSNPQGLANIRKRQAKYPKKKIVAYKSMLWGQLLVILLYSFIFLYLFTNIDYSRYPGYFSMQLTLFVVMSVLTAFSSLFAVFYNSRDSRLYLPLPVTEQEIFLAKLFSSVGYNLAYLMPILPLFVITYQQISGSFFLAVPLALLQFLILTAFSVALSVVLVHFLGKLLMRTRYKNAISTLLMGASVVISVGLILFLQNNPLVDRSLTPEQTDAIPDMPTIPLSIGFHEISQNLFSLHYWLLILMTILLIAFVVTTVIPNYYQQLNRIDEKQTVRRKAKQQTGLLGNVLVRHHLSTLKDPTLIFTAFSATLIFTLMFGIQISRHSGFFQKIPGSYFGIALLVGLALGYLTSASFTSVGISLERENYHFIRSLPLSFRGFLRQKFWTLWLIQTAIPLLIYLIIGILLKTPPLILFGFTAGLLLVAYSASLASYKYDSKHLSLNWQNVSELFTRRGQLFTILTIFGTIILAGLLTFGAFLLIAVIGPWPVSWLILLLSLAATTGCHLYYERNFWQQFDH